MPDSAERRNQATAEGCILSRFDGDLGYFRGLVLDIGARVLNQVRLAEIAEAHHEQPPSQRDCVIFGDLQGIAVTASDLLERSLHAVAREDIHLAVALDGKDLARLFRGAVRRLPTDLTQDPRNRRWVIDAILGMRAMERIGDHACSIARNLIFSVTGKDIRHADVTGLQTG